LYLRQVVRYFFRYHRDDFEADFREWLASDPHFYGNRILRSMDKERQPGGEDLT
jgi:hypothetical protein